MMQDDEVILSEMAETRQCTIAVYQQMVKLLAVEPASLGWKVREPGAPDVTLGIIRQALRDAPEATRALLREVATNDEKIVRLTRTLIGEEGR